MTHHDALGGLIAAAFTPLRADGSLHPERVPDIVEFVLGQGINGLFLCGSTGEGTSLTTDERMRITEAYAAATNRRVPVIAHVGHNALEDARTLAAHAQRLEVEAIAAAPPSYFRPDSVDGLVDCLARIADAAPDLPLYYYHIPPLTGVHFRMTDLLERAADRLPTLAGIKFSSVQLDDLQGCIAFDDGRYNILFGADEMLLAGLAMGAPGAVGSTYNFFAPIYRRVINAMAQGDLATARTHQLLATRAVHAVLSFGGHNALKATMAILGVDCGPSRLPVPPLDDARRSDLRDTLEQVLGDALKTSMPS